MKVALQPISSIHILTRKVFFGSGGKSNWKQTFLRKQITLVTNTCKPKPTRQNTMYMTIWVINSCIYRNTYIIAYNRHYPCWLRNPMKMAEFLHREGNLADWASINIARAPIQCNQVKKRPFLKRLPLRLSSLKRLFRKNESKTYSNWGMAQLLLNQHDRLVYNQ